MTLRPEFGVFTAMSLFMSACLFKTTTLPENENFNIGFFILFLFLFHVAALQRDELLCSLVLQEVHEHAEECGLYW